MKRLSGADAFFLYSERETWPMHIGSLVTIDPSDVPDFGPAVVGKLAAERIWDVPEFTMKVKEVPLGLARPILVDDPDFDVDRHLHQATVAPPGGPRELGALVGDLVSERLDRDRPLWELWVIDGLASGEVAVLAKVHHALADGASGAGIGTMLCDLERDPPPRPPAARTRPHDRAPSDLELLASGALSAAVAPARLAAWAAEFSARTIRRAVAAGREGVPGPFTHAPPVPWNGRLTPHRGFAFTSVPLGQVKAVGRAAGVTVNDVVLAVCAGALRDWLVTHGGLPAKPLLAAVPVSMRAAAELDLGNKISTVFTPLETHVTDPADRLRRISAHATAAKKINQAVLGKGDIRRLSGLVVPRLASLAWSLYVAAGLENVVPIPSDLVISNVRGPNVPLYVGGARITGMHPVPPAVASQGMDVTVMSYVESVGFGFTVDRGRFADPWDLADRIPGALDELMRAVRVPRRAARGAGRSAGAVGAAREGGGP